MNQRQKVAVLLTKIGIRPSYKGYPYLAEVIFLASELTVPIAITDLYAQASKTFHVTPNTVQNNIRTVLKNYWNSGYCEKLSKITGYPIHENLPAKEFVYLIADYISRS